MALHFHFRMERRFPRHCVNILAYRVQLDVITCVFYIMLGEEEAKTRSVYLECCQLARTIHAINAATRAAISRFDNKGVIVPWNTLKKARMGNKVATWNG